MNFFNNLITAISGEVIFLPRRTVAASLKKLLFPNCLTCNNLPVKQHSEAKHLR